MLLGRQATNKQRPHFPSTFLFPLLLPPGLISAGLSESAVRIPDQRTRGFDQLLRARRTRRRRGAMREPVSLSFGAGSSGSLCLISQLTRHGMSRSWPFVGRGVIFACSFVVCRKTARWKSACEAALNVIINV